MIGNLFQRIGHWVSYHTNLGIELPTKAEKRQVDRLSKQFAENRMNNSKPQIMEDPDMRTKKESEKDYATILIENIPTEYKKESINHSHASEQEGEKSNITSITAFHSSLPENIGLKSAYKQEFDIEKELNKPEEKIKYDL